MAADPRLTPERREREVAMMRDPSRWPYDYLPLKRMLAGEGHMAFGYLEGPTPTVELAGGGRVEYGSFEELHEAGWLVD